MLGTGYGECKTKKSASKDFRARGGVVIDDVLLIDAPSDIFDCAEALGFSDVLSRVTSVLISHSHSGHFSLQSIKKLAKKKKITVYGSRAVISMLPESDNVTGVVIDEFTHVNLGRHDIVALPASHATEIPGERCFNFAIVSGERSLLYALDGGGIDHRAWQVIKNLSLDAIIADASLGSEPVSEGNVYHNDLHSLARMRDIMRASGVAHEKTKFILSHIPMSKKLSVHEELSPLAREYGMTLAYDGYFVTV
jgi:L-ascorbate metabolism protein UlaG (beta-lactamase superfamily)